MNALLIGDFILDNYIFGDVNRISPEAPVPIFLENATKNKMVLGGALNVGRNLNNLNNSVILLGITGIDIAGEKMLELIEKEGFKKDYIIRTDKSVTSQKTRFITNNQQLLRWDFEENTYSELNEKKLIATMHSLMDKTDFVIISDYNKGVCSDSLINENIEVANKKKINVFIDPKGSDFHKYKNAYCITPNILETKAVYKKDLITNKNFEEACKFICDTFNIETCIITRGKDGMTVYDSKKFCHIKSKTKDVFDVSGAGDTVIATLATYTARGKNLIDAAKIANIAAQHVVGKFGTTPITEEELNKYL
ncbi:MAG: bifunctional heptose 7-phosphate kinase/heptose 1-phosphate adenyltransferase [Candidatus Neomarinimicrobiota bacterium]